MTEGADPLKILSELPLLKCEMFKTADSTPVSFCDVLDAYFNAVFACITRMRELDRMIDSINARDLNAPEWFIHGFEQLEAANDAYVKARERLERHIDVEKKRIEDDTNRITQRTNEYRKLAQKNLQMVSKRSVIPEIRSAHYTQIFDLSERGRIEYTRDDTQKEVNIGLTAWKNGVQTHVIKIRHNIRYDYDRVQKWWNGCLVEDSLSHNQTWLNGFILFENEIEARFGYSPRCDDSMRNVELDIREMPHDRSVLIERERVEKLHYDPKKAREERLNFIKEYSERLKMDVDKTNMVD